MENDKNINKISFFRRHLNILVLVVNILILCLTVMFYSMYTSAYDKRSMDENLRNITNINASAATNTSALFDSWNTKLNDMKQHIEANDMDLDSALDLIYGTNSSNNRFFHLVGSDYKGFLATKGDDLKYIPIDYTNLDYKSLQNIFDAANLSIDNTKLQFINEFTESGPTALKSFAAYKYIDIFGEETPWTLMLCVKATEVVELLNIQDDFVGQSTVIIDSTGKFVVNGGHYSATNFFNYLENRNYVNFQQRTQLENTVKQEESGTFSCKSTDEPYEEKYFTYKKMDSVGDAVWYCITSVPSSSFVLPDFNATYLIFIFVCLFLLFVIDILWLNYINKLLKDTMSREMKANSAKSSFLSRISHEIRTPLNAIIGYNAIAINELSRKATPEEHKQSEMKVMDCLDKNGIASKHLLTIINDVLDMSAIENGKVIITHDKFDFKGLVTSITTIFYSLAKTKGIDFDVIFSHLTEEWFVGDQMRTNQILTNLLSNAIKFTPAGGKVELKIFQPDDKENSSHIHFTVSDTGIGMSEEYLSHIWTPFEQADASISRRFGGTGLGLSITKSLVDLMNGKIEVKSTLGKGTVFDLDLYYEPAEQFTGGNTYDFSNINALVVDDDNTTCDYVKLLFHRCGARCATAISGEDAINAVKLSVKKSDPFTMCLVDWHMPKMDGIDTIKNIVSIVGSNLPIVVLTAYDFSEIAEVASKIGVVKFISKPLFQSSLFDLLMNIIGEQRPTVIEEKVKYSFHGKRVLLAEDNSMNMEIAEYLLNSVGFEIEKAITGREAVDMFLNSSSGKYDAILMDIHMPVLNGLDATKEIRNSSHSDAKTIPIIAMTADAFAENIAEALSAGMNEHIAKPIDSTLLYITLEKYIKN